MNGQQFTSDSQRRRRLVTPRRIGVRTPNRLTFPEKADMTTTKPFAVLGALALLAAAACAGDPTPLAPTAAPSAAVVVVSADHRSERAAAAAAPTAVQTALLREAPLAEDVTVSRAIGPAGGTLEIPAAGLRVYVLPGALHRTTTITATALEGDMVAYEFGPHGTRFAVPLILVQSTRGTNAASLPRGTVLQGGYFTGREMLDRGSKRARVAEVLPTFGVALDDAVAFNVWHFSGYLFGWGRGGGRTALWQEED
jgi:hypothetical protein